jgi:hypothetical protein
VENRHLYPNFPQLLRLHIVWKKKDRFDDANLQSVEKKLSNHGGYGDEKTNGAVTSLRAI